MNNLHYSKSRILENKTLVCMLVCEGDVKLGLSIFVGKLYWKIELHLCKMGNNLVSH